MALYLELEGTKAHKCFLSPDMMPSWMLEVPDWDLASQS